MNIIEKVTYYFFGETRLSKSDALWLYGISALTGIILLTVILPIWIQNTFNIGGIN